MKTWKQEKRKIALAIGETVFNSSCKVQKYSLISTSTQRKSIDGSRLITAD